MGKIKIEWPRHVDVGEKVKFRIDTKIYQEYGEREFTVIAVKDKQNIFPAKIRKRLSTKLVPILALNVSQIVELKEFPGQWFDTIMFQLEPKVFELEPVEVFKVSY
jgi:hypothetical protein